MRGRVYWVDANVLLRFLTGEPEEMSRRALHLIERSRQREVVLKVHSVAVAETVWVLQSFYGYSSGEIPEVLAQLLEDHGLQLEEGRVVLSALATMADANVDFADALLAERARISGEGIASFDRDFERLGAELCREL